VGTKNTFLGGKLLINLDGFYYDYKDLQVNVFTATTVTTENAARARIYGLEFETKVRPVKNLELAATFSAIHSEYLDFFSLNPLRVGIPGEGPEDLSGRPIAHTPKRTADGNVSYKIPIGDTGSLNLRYDLRYNSGWYGDPFQENVGLKQSAYTVHNARVAYDLGGYELGAFVANFTNKIYAENRYTFGTGAGVVASWAPRRTWGIFANAKF
jgi:iron complex outermembrane recepter protein